MSVVMLCLGLASGQPGPRGQYLLSYHRESGFSEWTPDKDQALKFTDWSEAMQTYHAVLPSQPTRPWDGRPNRPLTAFAVEFVNLEGD